MFREMLLNLQKLKSLTTEYILEKSSRMVSAYEDVLENLGGAVCRDVATVIHSKKQEPLEQQFFKLLLNNSLESCFQTYKFPSVFTCLS
ncbi:unnamed protein product [Acanthoscelides obtectus]|uniref:Uncharacterized protein n=1 Tax=Acanthoscelides obtectus TaxID=200917 RepID=A0A9P0K8C7_ACAOB|nr:unnamed protein product [Acanthoscelides obtectus]CAK1632335.1 hypothetical protein AOBTE_LOCUS7487 [Acanthoscelides obtectus]